MQPTNDPDRTEGLVFQPVPTREDMQALSEEASKARSGRARLFIAVVFLAGVVVAAGAGMAMVKQNAAAAAEQADLHIKKLTEQIKTKDTQLQSQAETIRQQKSEIDSFAPFQSIVVLQRQSDQLEDEIAALLAQPSRAGAPKRLTELPAEVEWLDQTVNALQTRRDRLEQIKTQIEAWPPAPVAPRPD
ncbi:MAG: hypothetical protein C0456_05935 [Hyphomonas sp.]|uniref:hypothetical protein n=1 Tax=Hyphomonas sp. TaxID=87 RepID=UPI001D617B26|nr:hypothetical protein [Hyphomonas sp.]MBA4226158.1 hypothetical protein [Hyphomonas sp.]